MNKYDYTLSSFIDMEKNEIIELRIITRKEIEILRLKKEQFLILKKENCLLTPIDSKIWTKKVESDGHLCPFCKNFFRCPKVMEPDFLLTRFDTTKERITELFLASKRIEKYGFIKAGYETATSFIVLSCSCFKCSNHVVIDEENKEKKKLPKSSPVNILKEDKKLSLPNMSYDEDWNKIIKGIRNFSRSDFYKKK